MDGRVGMAALLAEEDAPAPCMATLYEQSAAQLPIYAQPRFVRVLRDASEVRHNAAPATCRDGASHQTRDGTSVC